MRRLLLLVSAALLLAVGAAQAARTPRVWLDGPAIVVGSGFPAGRVTVTVHGAITAHKIVRAASSGRFTVRFASPVARACRFTVITAIGANGVHATTKIGGAGKNCPPPAQP